MSQHSKLFEPCCLAHPMITGEGLNDDVSSGSKNKPLGSLTIHGKDTL